MQAQDVTGFAPSPESPPKVTWSLHLLLPHHNAGSNTDVSLLNFERIGFLLSEPPETDAELRFINEHGPMHEIYQRYGGMSEQRLVTSFTCEVVNLHNQNSGFLSQG